MCVVVLPRPAQLFQIRDNCQLYSPLAVKHSHARAGHVTRAGRSILSHVTLFLPNSYSSGVYGRLGCVTWFCHVTLGSANEEQLTVLATAVMCFVRWLVIGPCSSRDRCRRKLIGSSTVRDLGCRQVIGPHTSRDLYRSRY